MTGDILDDGNGNEKRIKDYVCFLLTFLLLRLAFMQLIMDKEHYDRLGFSETDTNSSFGKKSEDSMEK